jgi:hypothetical protein
MGMGEEELPPHMQLGALRAMAPPSIGIDRSWVWALPAAAALRSGAAEVRFPLRCSGAAEQSRAKPGWAGLAGCKPPLPLPSPSRPRSGPAHGSGGGPRSRPPPPLPPCVRAAGTAPQPPSPSDPPF